LGTQEVLALGNLDAQRDWGYAKDYVECMWMMLQQEQPDDYVIATGKAYSVRQFVEWAFDEVGITLRWEGSGPDEVGVDISNGVVRVKINPRYFRPSEVDLLCGDASKAKICLGWEPKTTVRDLVKIMMISDLESEKSALKQT